MDPDRLQPDFRPALSRRARLRHDPVRQAHVLLLPERVVMLNRSAAEILELCDGTRTVAEVTRVLEERYPGTPLADDVAGFLRDARARGWIA